tara:strand:+ start:1895 stop:2500 length:606 start_codon:yes stop_codon:yes gene_type:complete
MYLSKGFICVLLVSLISLVSHSQFVFIKSVNQIEKKIYINYDNVGDSGKYDIKLYIKPTNSLKWSNELTNVTGDVGYNQKVGKNKQIVWDVIKNRDKLIGEFIFGIEAINLRKIEEEESELYLESVTAEIERELSRSKKYRAEAAAIRQAVNQNRKEEIELEQKIKKRKDYTKIKERNEKIFKVSVGIVTILFLSSDLWLW